MYIRTNSASPSIRDLLEHLLTETMACLFIGGVDGESVSNACAAVHGLATILPVASLSDVLTTGQISELVAFGVKWT
jgi:hypothetical protein